MLTSPMLCEGFPFEVREPASVSAGPEALACGLTGSSNRAAAARPLSAVEPWPSRRLSERSPLGTTIPREEQNGSPANLDGTGRPDAGNSTGASCAALFHYHPPPSRWTG